MFLQRFAFPGDPPRMAELTDIVLAAMGDGPVSVKYRSGAVAVKLPADRAKRRRREITISVRVEEKLVSVRGTHGTEWGNVCKQLQQQGGEKQLPAQQKVAPSV